MNIYQSERVKGIVVVVEALLFEKGYVFNKKNVVKVLKKLHLDSYIEDVVTTYFSPTSTPKYYLKYTDYSGGEEVATGFMENENGLVWYFDKVWAEKIANSLSNEFKNVTVVQE